MHRDAPQQTALGPAPALAEEAAPCIDLAHLKRYTFGERALMREVLELFRAQSDACLARLAASSSEDEWREAAHALKGSARAVGACRVTEAAERAETLSAVALSQGRERSLQAVERAIEEANAEIAALLACDL